MRSNWFSGASRLLKYSRNGKLLTRGRSTKATSTSLDSQYKDAATTEGGKSESVEESPEQQPKLPTREPLAKNFFIGVVDKELLAYPEVIARDEMAQLQNALLPLKNYFEEPREVEDKSSTETIRQLGLYGLNVPTEYDGRGYGWSASLLASEPDSTDVNVTLGLLRYSIHLR